MIDRIPFPKDYIIKGKFILHSGGNSNIFYDVERVMVEDPFSLSHFLSQIVYLESNHYVGILTGGLIMCVAAHVRTEGSKCSYIKNGQLIGKKPEDKWILFDDVVTTGRSLLEAISIVGTNPSRIIVGIDRREKNENPIAESIFEI